MVGTEMRSISYEVRGREQAKRLYGVRINYPFGCTVAQTVSHREGPNSIPGQSIRDF
jgi:hypothetical protein